jgi:hypothetical protein
MNPSTLWGAPFTVAFVKSGPPPPQTSTTAPFEEMLMVDAFSNFRQILNDVILAPAMGQFLEMANNAKANAAAATQHLCEIRNSRLIVRRRLWIVLHGRADAAGRGAGEWACGAYGRGEQRGPADGDAATADVR